MGHCCPSRQQCNQAHSIQLDICCSSNRAGQGAFSSRGFATYGRTCLYLLILPLICKGWMVSFIQEQMFCLPRCSAIRRSISLTPVQPTLLFLFWYLLTTGPSGQAATKGILCQSRLLQYFFLLSVSLDGSVKYLAWHGLNPEDSLN